MKLKWWGARGKSSAHAVTTFDKRLREALVQLATKKREDTVPKHDSTRFEVFFRLHVRLCDSHVVPCQREASS